MMTEDMIDLDPDYRRGKWMIEYQVDGAYDLIRFWVLYGPWHIQD